MCRPDGTKAAYRRASAAFRHFLRAEGEESWVTPGSEGPTAPSHHPGQRADPMGPALPGKEGCTGPGWPRLGTEPVLLPLGTRGWRSRSPPSRAQTSHPDSGWAGEVVHHPPSLTPARASSSARDPCGKPRSPPQPGVWEDPGTQTGCRAGTGLPLARALFPHTLPAAVKRPLRKTTTGVAGAWPWAGEAPAGPELSLDGSPGHTQPRAVTKRFSGREKSLPPGPALRRESPERHSHVLGLYPGLWALCTGLEEPTRASGGAESVAAPTLRGQRGWGASAGCRKMHLP